MAERENIRSRLKKHQLTQVWLINQLGLRGIVTDKTEMSSVLAGTRSGSKADAIIELSHDILDKYEEGSVLVKCQKQDDVKTRAKTLYDNYKLWCKSNGYYVCSMKKFNAELMAHPEWYEQKSVSGGVAVYYGIMMKTTG